MPCEFPTLTTSLFTRAMSHLHSVVVFTSLMTTLTHLINNDRAIVYGNPHVCVISQRHCITTKNWQSFDYLMFVMLIAHNQKLFFNCVGPAITRMTESTKTPFCTIATLHLIAIYMMDRHSSSIYNLAFSTNNTFPLISIADFSNPFWIRIFCVWFLLSV